MSLRYVFDDNDGILDVTPTPSEGVVISGDARLDRDDVRELRNILDRWLEATEPGVTWVNT